MTSFPTLPTGPLEQWSSDPFKPDVGAGPASVVMKVQGLPVPTQNRICTAGTYLERGFRRPECPSTG